MFHSGALLIGRLSVTRLARQLQSRAMRLSPHPQLGVRVVGVSDRPCVCTGGLGQLGAHVGVTGRLIIDIFFGFASHGLWRMRERSAGRSNETLGFAGAGLKGTLQSQKHQAPSEKSRGGIPLQLLKRVDAGRGVGGGEILQGRFI